MSFRETNGFASKAIIILVTLTLIAMAGVGTTVYFYLQYQKTQEQLKSSAAATESQNLVTEVGKLIVLPMGEQPRVATVTNINELKGQSFFAHAKNGDKVLIYTKAQEAFLYDPSQKKIVQVGPINLNQTTPTPKTSPTATASATPTKASTK